MGLLSDCYSALPKAREIKQSGGGPAPSPESLRADPELVRAAVAVIPNTSDLFPGREDYVNVAYAIKAAVADDAEGFTIFADWAARWTDGFNKPEDVADLWGELPGPYKRGANWLFELAQTYGGYQRGAEYFDKEMAAAAIVATHEQHAAQAARFKIEQFDDVADAALSETTPYLIQGVLDAEASCVLYGASNAGKTFVATDAAASIASGRSYAGRKVRQGPVLYVAGEGTRGFRRRAAALRRKYGSLPDFHVLMMAVNLFDPLADLQPLILAIAGIGKKFVLIVVDTLARAMAGGDENSTKDMSAFVRNLDVLRAATGAAIMLVHHTGKDESKGARGSSVLRAAVDTEIEVKDGRITVTKQRDLDKEWTAAFSLCVEDLGLNPEGDRVTSCVVQLDASAPTPALDGLSPKDREVLAIVQDLFEGLAKPSHGVATKLVVDQTLENGRPLPGTTVRGILRKLHGKNALWKPSDGRWAPVRTPEMVARDYFVPPLAQEARHSD